MNISILFPSGQCMWNLLFFPKKKTYSRDYFTHKLLKALDYISDQTFWFTHNLTCLRKISTQAPPYLCFSAQYVICPNKKDILGLLTHDVHLFYVRKWSHSLTSTQWDVVPLPKSRILWSFSTDFFSTNRLQAIDHATQKQHALAYRKPTFIRKCLIFLRQKEDCAIHLHILSHCHSHSFLQMCFF